SMHSVTDSSGPSGRILSKTFFFPGFVAGTGGLLRERDILAQHERWQHDERSCRRLLLNELSLDAIPQSAADALWISVFTYESAALASWFTAMAEGDEPIICLVPQGKVLASIAEYLGRKSPLAPGDVVGLGALTIAVIPFLTQDDYDRLLSLCDLNLVRGEDSFVRAQWAAQPLLWHIYPQDDGIHMDKLRAFLVLYCGESSGAASQELKALRQFWEFWNLGEDCRELWHHLRPQLPGLREQARKWQQELAQMPDLAANLVSYHRQQQC
ncbi:MAG: elongation factor P maturation arginine rhamnosyltransferase EarP, partial [Hydrogenophaga sp.]|nr:elongation factor P maturation arginine rhamnosyltransferase EarP [Hydrogenophaga sp.]